LFFDLTFERWSKPHKGSITVMPVPIADRALQGNTGPTLESVAFTLAIAGVVVSFLYFGREILIPLALASLLSFVLWPIIALMRKAHVGRVTSVLAAFVLTIGGLAALGAVMTFQVSELVSDLPRYESNLREKVKALKGASTPSAAMEKAADAIQGLQDELKKDDRVEPSPGSPSQSQASPTTVQPPVGNSSNPIVVEIHERSSNVLQTYQDLVKPLISPLTTTALVMLFLLFILMQREDLRDRALRLAGGADLQRSTLAMNDAADRLSRFFAIQLALNSAFGIVIGAGLALIGVPSPVLWGMLASLMRFVPYVGSLIAAIFPIALAAAVDPSWSMVIATAALFLVAEPVAGQVLEPMLYGKNTGLSPVAVVVSALFWTLMWGPVGLLLSTPLTVCLVVLGKHIPALSFLNVALGDEPALAPEQRLYQRLLTGDAGEAAAVAEEDCKPLGMTSYYSDVARKTISMAHLDAVRGRLDRDAQHEFLTTIHELIADLSDYDLNGPVAGAKIEIPDSSVQTSNIESSNSVAHNRKLKIVCLPTRSALDEAASELCSQLLLKNGLNSEVLRRSEIEALAASLLSAPHTFVCLSYFGSSSPLHVRSLVRRLKQIAPQIQILAGFWMLGDDEAKVLTWQKSVGADFAASSLTHVVEICLAAAARTPLSSSTISKDTGGIVQDSARVA
jgi:predicted PurR-regulated permease PerM